MVHNGRYLTALGEEGWVYGYVSQNSASQLRSLEMFPGFSKTSSDSLYFERTKPEIHEQRFKHTHPPPN